MLFEISQIYIQQHREHSDITDSYMYGNCKENSMPIALYAPLVFENRMTDDIMMMMMMMIISSSVVWLIDESTLVMFYCTIIEVFH